MKQFMFATLGAIVLAGCGSGTSENTTDAAVEAHNPEIKLANGTYALPFDTLTGAYDEKIGYCGSYCTTVEKFEAACSASQNIQQSALLSNVLVNSQFRRIIENNGYEKMEFKWYPEDKWCVATVSVSGILDGSSISMTKRFMAKEIEISDGMGMFASIAQMAD